MENPVGEGSCQLSSDISLVPEPRVRVARAGGRRWGGVGRKPAAGGPRDVRLPQSSQGRGLEGEEQGLLETHSGAHARTHTHTHTHRVTPPNMCPETPGTHRFTSTGTGSRHTVTHTLTQSHRGLTKSARGVSTPAPSQPHTHTRTHGQTQPNTDTQPHKGPHHARTHMRMLTRAGRDRPEGSPAGTPRNGLGLWATGYPGAGTAARVPLPLPE